MATSTTPIKRARKLTQQETNDLIESFNVLAGQHEERTQEVFDLRAALAEAEQALRTALTRIRLMKKL